MNFLLTEYIYPLKRKFPLSRKLKMYLDNPRTSEEIKFVRGYISQAYKFDSAFWASEEDLLPYLQEFLEATSQSDGYVKKLKEKYSVVAKQ